jgi:hypothetical protein
MKHLTLLLTLALFGCSPETLPDNEYSYFLMTSHPKEKIYYPEDTLEFKFNMEITPSSIEKVEVTVEDGDEIEPTIECSDKTVTISQLPPEKLITVTFLPGLKSIDNRPLVSMYGDIPSSRELSYTFTIGKEFPKILSTVPDDGKISNSIAFEFSEPVEISRENIAPAPDELYSFESYILLFYNNPPEEITIENVTTPVREGTLPSIKLKFTPGETSEKKDLNYREEVSDMEYLLELEDSTAVAVKNEGELSLCSGVCIFKKENLNPSTEYSFKFTIYGKEGKSELIQDITTLEPLPHILISEIMHSPAGEPEKSYEFIELYNYGTVAFNLEGCSVDDKNDGSGEDPLLPQVSGNYTLQPGELALILGNESNLHMEISTSPTIFFVDDTTIADAGLTSSESIEIKCGENREIVDRYDGTFKDSEKNFSVTRDTQGNRCSSQTSGGTPGSYISCP